MIMNYSSHASFKKNGFVIIPNVLKKNDVERIRQVIYDHTLSTNARFLDIESFLDNEKLLNILIELQFKDEVVSTLRKIWGNEFCYLNDIDLQCNMFGVASKNRGWHRDCGSELGYTQNKYLFERDYKVAKVGVYLQDNTLDFGGGIDVMPASHKDFKSFFGSVILQFGYLYILERLRLISAKIFPRRFFIPISAGSVVIFDSRLHHRSSPPRSIELTIEEQKAERVGYSKINYANSKYVLYWQVATSKNGLQYLDNLMKRAALNELNREKKNSELLFTKILAHSFPNQYPVVYRDFVNQTQGLSIVSPSPSTADVWRAALDRIRSQ